MTHSWENSRENENFIFCIPKIWVTKFSRSWHIFLRKLDHILQRMTPSAIFFKKSDFSRNASKAHWLLHLLPRRQRELKEVKLKKRRTQLYPKNCHKFIFNLISILLKCVVIMVMPHQGQETIAGQINPQRRRVIYNNLHWHLILKISCPC